MPCCASSWLRAVATSARRLRSEEHTSELQSRLHLVCRLLLEKKKRHIVQRKTGALTTQRVTDARALGKGCVKADNISTMAYMRAAAALDIPVPGTEFDAVVLI